MIARATLVAFLVLAQTLPGTVPVRAESKETPAPDGCIKRLGRTGNYICCGGPVYWSCRKLPSTIPGKLNNAQ